MNPKLDSEVTKAPKPPEETAPAQPQADPMAIIKVIVHRTRIGGHVKALNHEQDLPLSQAKVLKDEGFIRILGIR